LYRFRQMLGSNDIGPFMVGDSPGQFQDAVKSPRRQVQLFHCGFQQALR
jgi:hypothetical protein